MLYLITFDHDISTTPMSVGELVVRHQDGHDLSELEFTTPDIPVDATDVLQPALRNGFRHPHGLLVDSSLVDIMTATHRLEQSSAAQLAVEAQLEELSVGAVAVTHAGHAQLKDQVARDARLDHQEAIAWARTARRELLARPVDQGLQQYWDTRGSLSAAL